MSLELSCSYSKKFDRFYPLALKHIKEKNEVWVSPLLASNSMEGLKGFKKQEEDRDALKFRPAHFCKWSGSIPTYFLSILQIIQKKEQNI